jgi:hypothetical protein
MTGFLRWCRNTMSETARMVRADAALYLFVLAYTAAGLFLLQLTGTEDSATYWVYVRRWAIIFILFFPMVAIIIDAARVVHRLNARRGLAMRRAFSPVRMATLASGVALLMVMVLFQGTFTSLKNAMTYWRDGFQYDRIQADIDRLLHFGVDPWRLLYSFGEHDVIRTMVEWNYNVLWFVLCFGLLFFVATSPRAAAIRGRYITCFMLTWIVCGNVFATLFLSAGPAFYGEVTGDAARFAEQLAFLARGAESPNSAVAYQAYLWSLHEAGATSFGSGISAFPSVHVALVAMNAFFIAEYSRRLGIAAFAYVAFIIASSVYLAWHYAIDGYVSIAIVAVIHVLVKRYARTGMADRRRPISASGPSAHPETEAAATAS